MKHQEIKLISFCLAGLIAFLGFVIDVPHYSSDVWFFMSMFTLPLSLIMGLLGFTYSNLFKRKNELHQIFIFLLKSCYAFFLIGSLWLVGYIILRGLLDSDFHFFANQDLIENLKKYLFYTIIGFQIVALLFALLFDIIKTGDNPPKNQQKI